MKTYPRFLLITLLHGVLITASGGHSALLAARSNIVAEPALEPIPTGDLDAANQVKAALAADASDGAIKTLKKDIVETKWKALPNATLRGGLTQSLSFTDKVVEPGGYQYEAVSHSLTITFTHGAKLILELSRDHKHLQYPKGAAVYELVTE